MKKINFQKLNSNINIFIILIISFFVIVNTVLVLETFTFKNPKIQQLISLITYLLLTIYLSRIFWFKNVFQWNKKGFTARINNFWGINKKFENIRKIEFNENNILIQEFNGNKIIINLANIEKKSQIKLVEIFKSRISKNRTAHNNGFAKCGTKV